MEISTVIHQTYSIINRIDWLYFRLNKNVNELTKEEKYTLNNDMEHLEHNFKLIKKYADEEAYEEMINYFNETLNEKGLKLK